VVVTFTGGVVTRLDATTETKNNVVSWDNVDYYEEGGFKLDFLPNTAGGFSRTSFKTSIEPTSGATARSV
jgi:hypothetical protein